MAPYLSVATNVPVRVCHVVSGFDGVVGSSLMSYYRNIDRDRFQFDFVVCGPDAEVPQDEIEALGGRVYRIAAPGDLAAFKKDGKELFGEPHGWTIVEAHLGEMSAYPLKWADRACITLRIAHAHQGDTGSAGDRLWKKTTKRALIHLASDMETGKRVFGEGQKFELVSDLCEDGEDEEKALGWLMQMYDFLVGWGGEVRCSVIVRVASRPALLGGGRK